MVFFWFYFYFKRPVNIENSQIKLTWKKNQKITFEFQSYGKIKFSDTEKNISFNKKINLSCLILCEILDINEIENEAQLACRIYDYTISENSVSNTLSLDQYPAYLILDLNGAIKNLTVKKCSDLKIKKSVASVLYNFQSTIKTGKKSWTVTETDEIGNYTAQYKNDGNSVVLRNIIKYNNLNKNNPYFNQANAVIKKSLTTFKIKQNKSWFSELNKNENFEIYKNRKRILSSKTNVKIKQIPGNLLKNRIEINNYVTQPDLLNKKESKINDNNKNISLSGKSDYPGNRNQINEILLKLKLLTPKDKTGNFDRELAKLVDLLKKSPKLAYELLNFIHSQSNIELHPVLFAVLEETGNSKIVQDVLLCVTENSTFLENDRLRALVALGGIEKIFPSSLQRLLSIDVTDKESEIPANLFLTVGRIASANENKIVKTDANYYLRNKFLEYSSSNKIDKENFGNLLKGIANSGSTEFLNDVVPLFDNSEPIIKQLAIETLRDMPAEKTDSVLKDLILSNDFVKSNTALKVLNFRQKITNKMNDFLFDKLNRIKQEDNKILTAKCLLKNKNNYPELLKIARQKETPFKVKHLLLEKIPIRTK